tara:strand:- start:337463 stop:338614 length:1152 start_codon:yes stop_codon:yes gene_type:complete
MNALRYARELVSFDSVSQKTNAPVSNYIEQTLTQLRFRTERIEYERDGVTKVNVIGCRDAEGTNAKSTASAGVAFFGHTDVVPADDWAIAEHGPFEPAVNDNRLYGRGSTDMKGPIACMLAAAENVKDQELNHPLYISCSADEELDHRGIKEVISRSSIYQELAVGGAKGIVGEPTEMQLVYAHKGGVQIVVTSQGEAAHSSTRAGVNANLAMIPFLSEAKAIYDETESNREWMDDEFDPPSLCMNLGINDHTAALNVKAAQSICTLCFRPMPSTDTEGLIARIAHAAESCGLAWKIIGTNPPFRRAPDSEFIDECTKLVGSPPPSTVGFGTEAGNLTEIEHMVVLGPGSIRQAHTIDEYIELDQLAAGESGYEKIVQRYCLS